MKKIYRGTLVHFKPFNKNAPKDWEFSAEYYKKIAKASIENCDNYIKFNVKDLGGPSEPSYKLFEKWLDSERLENYLRRGFEN